MVSNFRISFSDENKFAKEAQRRFKRNIICDYCLHKLKSKKQQLRIKKNEKCNKINKKFKQNVMIIRKKDKTFSFDCNQPRQI